MRRGLTVRCHWLEESWCRQRILLRHASVQIDRDLLMIPSVAIHMNREANEGMKYNVQTDLCPVFGDESAKESLCPLIAREIGVQEEAILSMDLFLYNRQRGTFIGANEEFLAAPRLDDLQCMYGSLIGFLNAPQHRAVSVYGAFDNEETGSESRRGQHPRFLRMCLPVSMQRAVDHRRTISGQWQEAF